MMINKVIMALSLALMLLWMPVQAQQDKVYTRLSEIKDPSQVYQIEIHYKRLRKVPPVIFQCVNLRRLDLSKNFIDTLSPEIGKLTNLEEINLNRNRLRNIPREIGNLTNLKVLNISRNPILELPDEMSNLVNMEDLILWMTGVVSFPPSFVALNYTLKKIDMRACPLTYDNQQDIETLLPSPIKRWDYVCNCK